MSLRKVGKDLPCVGAVAIRDEHGIARLVGVVGDAVAVRRPIDVHDLVAEKRARRAADNLSEETKAEASKQREELLAAARRDIEHETRRALDELRKEVADLTVTATEKITRKSLTEEDHRRLIEEALQEVDFEELAPSEGNGR